MISKCLQKLRLFPLYVRWSFAFNGRLSEELQLKRLDKIEAPNGPKQIILAQIANVLWRMGRKNAAIAQFRKARDSELEWGGRQNKNVSTYITLYCEYNVYLLLFGANKKASPEALKTFNRLKAVPVPASIRSYKLPIPQTPTGRMLN